MQHSWTPILVVLLIATSALAVTAVVAARIGDASPIVQPLVVTAIAALAGATRIFIR